jgi:hypothetical protein
MSEIEPLHQFAYENGADPIEHAVHQVEIQIETRDQIRSARVHTPNAYAVFKGDLGDDATARRIIAVLLDAGWSPPEVKP